MSMRDIPRSAVGGAVKLTRLPLDIVVSMLPGNGNGSGAKPVAAIAIDRFEATLRDAAGIALFDNELREDARRRRIAADERARELRLRVKADRRSAEADERFSERVEEAEDRRSEAEQRAERERAAAERRKQQRAASAARREQTRKAANRKVRAKVEEQIDEDADAARLEQLKAEAKALEEREAALTAQAEAQRLRDEATKKKAARKARSR
jgi:flagellar biosynthesis GTPase FlhF